MEEYEAEEDLNYREIKRRLFEQVEPFKDKATMEILKFIKDNDNLTKEEVARQMDTSGISSRPVTLRIIKNLLDKNVILNSPKKANAQSRLIINPEFDFKTLELNYLTLFIEEVRDFFDPIKHETRGANSTLIRELQQTIIDFGKKKDIYTPKQMEKFESDYRKEQIKQLEKLTPFRGLSA